MEMEVELTGTDATEETTLSLQDWIRNEQIAGLRAELRTGRPKEGELGAGLSGALSIISSGSATAVELTKSVYKWLKALKPKLRIRLVRGDMQLEIDAENLPELEKVLSTVLAKFDREGG